MQTETMDTVMDILRVEVKQWDVPIITLIAQTQKDPFRVLIATVLSLRTKDEVTAKAAERLFKQADTAQAMLSLTEEKIQKLIYPTGFYKTKAKNIRIICKILLDQYQGKVPDDMEKLLELPNVGRKTANLTLSEGFGIPAVTVDIHNFRILNRLGYTASKNPFETEMFIREKLPERYWMELNFILVAFGQHLCKPISPWCSKCPVNKYCERKNVKTSR